MTVARLMNFIRERESVRRLKEAGGPPPWTDDPILREYRFCNVRREDDRVTRWIRDNWREPHETNSDLWFAMVVARFINWPPTLDVLEFPVPWNRKTFLVRMAGLAQMKKKVYTGAYMVRADPETPGEPKYNYQERVVFTPMWNRRNELRPKIGDTLNSYHMLLGQFHGLGSFMAAQVVADLKYVEPLKSAKDWWTFAASGPGSRRGLNRVLGREVKAPWTEEEWRLELGRLQEQVGSVWVEKSMGPRIHAQDLQNCLCEFDKYERVRLGEGRPRARYRSQAS